MRKLKPGDRVKNYTIVDPIVSGAFAMTYRGFDDHRNDVFIKQFKSPTPVVDWYPAFVEHQVALQSRIAAHPVQNFAITLVDQFETGVPRVPCFFQVTEFVTKGRDLSALIDPSSTAGWHQRVVWAKVIMGSINQFHHAKIVHTDLKPENLFLIEDPAITAGYRLKVIDLDSAIFEGKPAPWHDNGYVGTPGYYSPEHGSRTTIPSAKSDIFTAGLILYELLAQGHPYATLSEDEYRDAVLRHAAPAPILRDSLAGTNDNDVRVTLHRMLSPDPAQRPDASEVLDILKGTTRPTTSPGMPPRPSTGRSPQPRPTSLRLRGQTDQVLELNITTPLCARLLRGIGEPEFWDKIFQVRLEQHEGVWYAVPNLEAANKTCLNNELLSSRTRLQANDVLSVGNVSKGIFKSPLRVEFGDD
ncbi:FHA domain-containing serine/threonine-protein kinase [Nannocystaceae bacterium ST9]